MKVKGHTIYTHTHTLQQVGMHSSTTMWQQYVADYNTDIAATQYYIGLSKTHNPTHSIALLFR